MFTKARIKLTLYYTLIITIVIVVFSGILFHTTSEHLREMNGPGMHQDNDPSYEKFVEHTMNDFTQNLLMSDLVVILISALLSYFLAGKTLDPIQKALDAQEQFSANASHELRTPLSVLKTQLEVFMKKKDSTHENAQKLAGSGLEEVERMIGMTESLLVLARSKKTNVPIETTPVDVSEIIDKTIGNLLTLATSKNIKLSFHKKEGVLVQGNENMFEQVFFNLIKNAVTYTPEGSVTVNIELKGDDVVVTVADTGIGISEKDMEHVFEPFYKTDKSRTVSSNGVGLGLSIVREIVEQIHGIIRMESEINKGTVVTVTFRRTT